MQTILVTGATGTIGSAILDHFKPNKEQRLYRSTRHLEHEDGHQLYFDLDHLPDTIARLAQVDVLFLLRPPQVTSEKVFKTLIRGAHEFGVQHIVFLSVQGADRTPFVPHAKIERLIRESGISYTFVRPSYFMNNLITAFEEDIRERCQIFVPAGRAKFLWVDAADIGKAIAAVLNDVRQHQNRVYTLTGSESERLSFLEVADILSQELGRDIKFVSPSPLRFFVAKRRVGVPASFISVMIMLHYGARFQRPAPVHLDLLHLTGQTPRSLATFVRTHATVWQ